MKTIKGILGLSLALAAAQAQAAVKQFEVKYRQAIYQDGNLTHTTQRQWMGFRLEVVSDEDGVKPESTRDGKPYLTGRKGERYSVRITNPLPVRVAVNLTVDGLNSISGKPTGITDGHKWILEPYATITLRGWQVNGGESRRFFFTDKRASYAKWQGDRLDKDLAANCGVIGAAFFWDQAELDRYYEQHPLYRWTYRPYPYNYSMGACDEALAAPRAKSAMGAPACQPAPDSLRQEAEKKEIAGTGMGERESHPTMQVDFHYDRGMYKASQALVVFYGFEEEHHPNPFPDMDFAPEMPQS